MDCVDMVYPKTPPKNKEELEILLEKWFTLQVKNMTKDDQFLSSLTIEAMFERQVENDANEANQSNEDMNGVDEPTYTKKVELPKSYSKKTATIIDILCDNKFDREGKLTEVNVSLNTVFPKLEGDKVTFIGSTFLRYGEIDPYMNHCIVLNSCSKPNLKDNTIIESYTNEQQVLLAWRELIQRENPDIIIGYNIFGFDYQFMFRRAEENNCLKDFLKLSRNIDEVCAQKDRETFQYKMEESSIKLASGQHDLRFIKMTGRLQIDLYNFFRREENLSSYKLDYVAGHFIGDYCKTVENIKNKTVVSTNNMMGLQVGSYIHFEEIGHTLDY
jgi:DNA polymerase elongation subunit (family B)